MSQYLYFEYFWHDLEVDHQNVTLTLSIFFPFLYILCNNIKLSNNRNRSLWVIFYWGNELHYGGEVIQLRNFFMLQWNCFFSIKFFWL